MRYYQLPLLEIDELIKIGEVERILSKVFRPAPSRPTLIAWIDEGLLDGRQIGSGGNWHVYKTSLDNFIRASQPIGQTKLAA